MKVTAKVQDNFSLQAWLEFALISTVPLAAKLIWLREFKSPGAVLSQDIATLRKFHPIAKAFDIQIAQESIDAVLNWSAKKEGQCYCIGDENYPHVLAEKLRHAPLIVYARGNISLLENPVLAILGAPNPTKRGLARAKNFAYELTQEGVIIVAGVSPGIAKSVFQGVQAARGEAIGVVGNPQTWDGSRLAEDIANSGLLLSEVAPSQQDSNASYSQRYRILATLAKLAVVVEAPATCETLKLVSDASDMGCEIAAVPADPDNSIARGGNFLLRDGAALVETSADILALLAGATQ